MPYMDKKEMATVIDHIKSVAASDDTPKKYAAVTMNLCYAQGSEFKQIPQALLYMTAKDFDTHTKELKTTFGCPESLAIKLLVDAHRKGLGLEDLYANCNWEESDNCHVVLIITDNDVEAEKNAALLRDFLSEVDDLEVLVYQPGMSVAELTKLEGAHESVEDVSKAAS